MGGCVIWYHSDALACAVEKAADVPQCIKTERTGMIWLVAFVFTR